MPSSAAHSDEGWAQSSSDKGQAHAFSPPTIQTSRNDQHPPQLLEKHIYLLTPLSSFPLKQPKSLSWWSHLQPSKDVYFYVICQPTLPCYHSWSQPAVRHCIKKDTACSKIHHPRNLCCSVLYWCLGLDTGEGWKEEGEKKIPPLGRITGDISPDQGGILAQIHVWRSYSLAWVKHWRLKTICKAIWRVWVEMCIPMHYTEQPHAEK